MTARRPAATASSGSSTWKPSVTRARRSTPRSSSWARASTPRPAWPAWRSWSTRSATPRAARPTSRSWRATTGPMPRHCRPRSWTASSATSCGSWTPRIRPWRSSTPPRRGSRTGCARRVRRTSSPSRPTSRRSGCPSAWSPGSSAAWTTTPARRSSSTWRGARASSRRWAVAVAMTAWWSSWAAGRRPGSGSASGWTAWRSSSQSRAAESPAVREGPLAVVVGAIPWTRSRGSGSPPTCERPGCGLGQISHDGSLAASWSPPARRVRTSR